MRAAFYLYFLFLIPSTLSHHVITSLRTDVTLPCDVTDHVLNPSANQALNKKITNTVWLMPSGQLARENAEKIAFSQDNTTAFLTIKRLNESDFGIYYCIKVFTDFSVETEKYTLDRDGPYFSALQSEREKNIIIGCISGSAFLLLCCLLYVIWYYRCSEKMKRKRQVLQDLQKGKDRFSTQLYDTVGCDLYTKRTQSQSTDSVVK